jgi:signal transduction histidine kinase/CheY-like chemotaxis protein
MTPVGRPDTRPLVAGRSLRVRLPALISLAILSTLLVFLWFAFREVETTLLHAGGDRAQAAADQIAGLFERSGQPGLDQLRNLANDPGVRACVRELHTATCDAVRARLTRQLTSGPRVVEIWTSSGVRAVSLSIPGAEAGGTPRELPNDRLATATGASPLQTRDDRLVFADQVIDVRDAPESEDGRPPVTIGRLVSRATFSINPPGALSQLVGQDAVVEIGNSSGSVWTDLSRVVQPPPVDLSTRGIREYRRNGATRLGAVTTIRNTPWAVWVEFSQAALVAPARQFLTRMLLLALGVAGFGALVIAILTERITTPLHQLSEAASDIARGDYSRRVPTIRRDEIGRLGDAFNRMTGEIQAMYGALKDSHDRTQFALAAAQMGIWHVNLANREVSWSETMAPLFGRTGDAAPRLELEMYQLVHPDDQGLLREACEAAVRQPAGDRSVEFRVIWPDRSVKWIDNRIRVIVGEDGQPARLLGIAMDITRSRVLEDQLRQAQKMEAVGRLAGGVAHDFNNLLTAILGYANLALESVPSGAPIAEDLSEIKKAAERAADLTAQLLAFSRQSVLQTVRVDINQLVAETGQLLRRLIGEHIRLTTVLESDLAPVQADVGQIEQVIINLAVNARDAMPTGGTLTIETANVELDASYLLDHVAVRPGAYVLLAVSDTGSGMDAATQQRIFEPFFTTKDRGKGTGLGLATVYGIVKQSHGYVWVYSEPGRGTTFKVYLPQARGVSEPTRAAAVKPYLPNGHEMIMVVEDERAVRLLTRVVLTRAGYQVVEASNADEAEQRFVDAIDLLVTDIIMPGSGGPALFERLSSQRPGLKVLYMSGYTGEMIAHQGHLDASVAFLQKPFTGDSLLRKVREVLDQS